MLPTGHGGYTMGIPREVVWCHTHPRGVGPQRMPVSSGRRACPIPTQTRFPSPLLVMLVKCGNKSRCNVKRAGAVRQDELLSTELRNEPGVIPTNADVRCKTFAPLILLCRGCNPSGVHIVVLFQAPACNVNIGRSGNVDKLEISFHF
jgi:hypothetical protein